MQETLDEEGRADHRLTEIAEAHINDDARFETDFTAPQARRLQYVPMEIVAQRRGSRAPLAIRNDADEELGVLDGLVAESDLGAARYAVVAGAAVLTHHRYLLPLSLLRFDEGTGVLRVSLEKSVAERYPAFDGGEFETMSGPEDRVGMLPEWLLKGVWITMPPQDVERLPDEARSFVNEFAPVPSDGVDATGDRERMVAHDRDAHVPPRREESAAPPHGDKLR